MFMLFCIFFSFCWIYMSELFGCRLGLQTLLRQICHPADISIYEHIASKANSFLQTFKNSLKFFPSHTHTIDSGKIIMINIQRVGLVIIIITCLKQGNTIPNSIMSAPLMQYVTKKIFSYYKILPPNDIYWAFFPWFISIKGALGSHSKCLTLLGGAWPLSSCGLSLVGGPWEASSENSSSTSSGMSESSEVLLPSIKSSSYSILSSTGLC